MEESFGLPSEVLVSIAAQIAVGLLSWVIVYLGAAIRGARAMHRAGDRWRLWEALGLTVFCAAVSVGLMAFLFQVPWAEAVIALGASAMATWLPYLLVQTRWRGFAVALVSAVLSGALLVPVWLGLLHTLISPDIVPYEYPVQAGVLLCSVQLASLLAAHCLVGMLWRPLAARDTSGRRP